MEPPKPAPARPRSFLPLFATNLFGTVNDNFLKTLASFAVIGWIEDPRLKPLYMGATAAALVLPYVLFSPLADRLATAFDKKTIVRLAKWAELPIMAVAVAGFRAHSAWTVVAAVLLMGLQSSLYSPARYALIRDIGGEGRISTGMGGMEGIAFGGMPIVSDHCGVGPDDAQHGVNGTRQRETGKKQQQNARGDAQALLGFVHDRNPPDDYLCVFSRARLCAPI